MNVLSRLFAIVAFPFLTFFWHLLTCGIFGWIAGLFFGDSILDILAKFGIEGYTMWQIGIFLGFISGFFKRMISFNRNQNQHQTAGTNVATQEQSNCLIINFNSSDNKKKKK